MLSIQSIMYFFLCLKKHTNYFGFNLTNEISSRNSLGLFLKYRLSVYGRFILKPEYVKHDLL